MAILTVSNVGQSFGEFDVFSGVNASIPRDGKVGLVGPNGIGKTTLLLILAGQRSPSAGTIHVARGTRIGYLSQESADAFVGRDHSVHDEMLTVFAELRAKEQRLRDMEIEIAAGDPSKELLEAYSQLQMQFELGGGYEYEQDIKRVLTGLGFPPSAWDQPLTQLSGRTKDASC
ncbi:MAG: ATP-binding cassette domain-containing protein [Chloroflexota bacterium]